MSKPLEVLIAEVVAEFSHKADEREFERLAKKLREALIKE